MNTYYGFNEHYRAIIRKPVLEVTDEELESLRVEEKRLKELNDIEYTRRVAVVEQFKKDSAGFFKERWETKQGKMRQNIINKLTPERPEIFNSYYNLESARAKALKEKATREREEKQKSDHNLYFAKCIRYLIEHGVDENDERFKNPIASAEEMESDRLINETLKTISENKTFLSFNGDENCEDCRGWDGESHRCDCCGRRVAWSYSGQIGSMYVYGEAH